MVTFALRSPSEKVGGLFYFGRMLDKIRLHAKGELPSDYHANLGKGFDEKCANFLRTNYDQLVERVNRGGTDKELGGRAQLPSGPSPGLSSHRLAPVP